jgi:hypothetical protein
MRFLLRVDPADVTAEFALITLWAPDTAGEPPGRHGGDAGGFVRYGCDRAAGPARGHRRGSPAARGEAGRVVEAYEALRIAAHRPRLGLDTDPPDHPHEVGWIENRRPPVQGLLPGPGDRVPGAQPGAIPRAGWCSCTSTVARPPCPPTRPGHDGRREIGFTGSAARHFELGPVALALIKRTGRSTATLRAGGVPAAQEVVRPPGHGRERQGHAQAPRGALAPRATETGRAAGTCGASRPASTGGAPAPRARHGTAPTPARIWPVLAGRPAAACPNVGSRQRAAAGRGPGPWEEGVRRAAPHAAGRLGQRPDAHDGRLRPLHPRRRRPVRRRQDAAAAVEATRRLQASGLAVSLDYLGETPPARTMRQPSPRVRRRCSARRRRAGSARTAARRSRSSPPRVGLHLPEHGEKTAAANIERICVAAMAAARRSPWT